jgi:hypothetical protein
VATGSAQSGQSVVIPVAASSQEPGTATNRRGLPGARVVAVATLAVILSAVGEVLVTDTIGRWTGITLVLVSVVAALVTRAGDRSLPAMMPPLAFLAAVLVAGQALVSSGSEPLWVREALMLVEVLGANAAWVVGATVLSVSITTIRHLVDRSRERRSR